MRFVVRVHFIVERIVDSSVEFGFVKRVLGLEKSQDCVAIPIPFIAATSGAHFRAGKLDFGRLGVLARVPRESFVDAIVGFPQPKHRRVGRLHVGAFDRRRVHMPKVQSAMTTAKKVAHVGRHRIQHFETGVHGSFDIGRPFFFLRGGRSHGHGVKGRPDGTGIAAIMWRATVA